MYHFFRQLWLVLGVKLMEINSNLFSRWMYKVPGLDLEFLVMFLKDCYKVGPVTSYKWSYGAPISRVSYNPSYLFIFGHL